MNFQELESKYYELKGKHAAGKLSDQEFLTEVEKLSLQDEQGCWWTIEAQTGQWYVFQEGEWVEAEPTPYRPTRRGSLSAVRRSDRGGCHFLRELWLQPGS